MKAKLIIIASFLALFCVFSVYSDPKDGNQSKSPSLKDLVQRMVEVARDRFHSGRLESAYKILQASLDIDPDNAEACYYLALVQKAMKANKDNPGVQLWYPTIPPKPANK